MNNALDKWKQGLAKTSKAKFGQIATIFAATEITSVTWNELEALPIQADLGSETTDIVLSAVEKRVNTQGLIKTQDLKGALRDELRSLLKMPTVIELNTPVAFQKSLDNMGVGN